MLLTQGKTMYRGHFKKHLIHGNFSDHGAIATIHNDDYTSCQESNKEKQPSGLHDEKNIYAWGVLVSVGAGGVAVAGAGAVCAATAGL